MQKWIHLTGICGNTTANIAKMFLDSGWFVTGSDVQYFPPAYNVIKNNDIPHVKGYSYDHLNKDFWENQLGKSLEINDNPDLVVIIESATNKNKEYFVCEKARSRCSSVF